MELQREYASDIVQLSSLIYRTLWEVQNGTTASTNHPVGGRQAGGDWGVASWLWASGILGVHTVQNQELFSIWVWRYISCFANESFYRMCYTQWKWVMTISGALKLQRGNILWQTELKHFYSDSLGVLLEISSPREVQSATGRAILQRRRSWASSTLPFPLWSMPPRWTVPTRSVGWSILLQRCLVWTICRSKQFVPVPKKCQAGIMQGS